MVIISNFILEVNTLGEYTVKIPEDREQQFFCPVCGSTLHLYDRRKRIWRKEGGTKLWVIIQRLKCRHCRRIHNALPGFLVPYKHYEAEVIEGVLDGVINEGDPDSEDENGEQHPCDSTMERWRQWMQRNQNQIEGSLRSVEIRILKLSYSDVSESLFGKIRDRYQEWLRIVCNVIYNSGGSLLT